MSVRVGQPVPDATVEAYVRGEHEPRTFGLADFRERWMVLFFYPRDFTFICPTEIAAFASLHPDFEREGAVLLGASTDSFDSHKAWYESDPRLQEVSHPVIADSSHKLSEAFDVLLEDGRALRGTFIVDPDGVLRHMSVNELDVGRNVEETLRCLQALKMGELCPVGWRPGQPTLSTADKWLAKAFPRLSDEVLTEAAGRLETIEYGPGDTIFEEGAPADRFYLVHRGEAEVLRSDADGKEHVVVIFGPGEFFGEIGLLSENRRTASVRAKTELEVFTLGREAFQELVEASDPTRKEFAEIVRERLAQVGG